MYVWDATATALEARVGWLPAAPPIIGLRNECGTGLVTDSIYLLLGGLHSRAGESAEDPLRRSAFAVGARCQCSRRSRGRGREGKKLKRIFRFSAAPPPQRTQLARPLDPNHPPHHRRLRHRAHRQRVLDNSKCWHPRFSLATMSSFVAIGGPNLSVFHSSWLRGEPLSLPVLTELAKTSTRGSAASQVSFAWSSTLWALGTSTRTSCGGRSWRETPPSRILSRI